MAAGNAVVAKPAPQTALIASLAVDLMYKAGVPADVLQLIPGGADVGAALTSSSKINGVAFTGSTATAQKIRQAMAANAAPGTPLIAETGGINAMIVDSTALPEHAVRDILMSAYRSAGQRCSALRVLYVQEDIADHLIDMLKGAMDELTLANPWAFSTDVGPLIDETAHATISSYVTKARENGKVIHELTAPNGGHFLAPVAIRVSGIKEVTKEVFGPVLHIATFKSEELDQVINDINATGYGLTFGLHTRIDDRVQNLVESIHAGNTYVNRNQIGAVVGSQPFGGEGLSGTGPKAGGPFYLPRFGRTPQPRTAPEMEQTMPGPTGESNRLRLVPRGPILCLGPTEAQREEQADMVKRLGGIPVVAETTMSPEKLASYTPMVAAIWWGEEPEARAYEKALAQRSHALTPLITGYPDVAHVMHERHVCIDTTASGGNAALLAEVAASEGD